MTTEYRAFYLAGPMSGIKQFNIPLFYEVAEYLRAQGHTVFNPCELDSVSVREACLKSMTGDISTLTDTWGEMLARDVKIVADHVDAVVLLPGWQKSKGALLEATVAALCKLPILWITADKELVFLTRRELAAALTGYLGE